MNEYTYTIDWTRVDYTYDGDAVIVYLPMAWEIEE